MSCIGRLWVLLCLCTLLATVFSRSRKVKCPYPHCVCSEYKRRAVCRGFENTTQLPTLPTFMEVLFLEKFLFSALSESSWGNLNVSILKELHLTNCHIREIDPKSFVDMASLEKLEISNDNIPASELANAFSGLQTLRLDFLVLNKLGLNSFPEMFFEYPGLQAVETLDISGNLLRTWNDSCLQVLPNLTTLQARGCRVEMWQASGHPNLRQIHLEESQLVRLPNFCDSNGFSLYPRILSLYLKGNNLYGLSADVFKCLWNLHKLDLSMNKMAVIKSNTFSSLPWLETLFLNDNRYVDLFERFAFNSSSLVKLEIQGGKRWNDKRVPHVDLFQWCPNLRNLQLQKTRMDLPVGQFRSLLLPMKNLEVLNLEKTYTNILPHDTFQHLTRLRELSLASNLLTAWSPDVFAGVRHIRELRMNENNIKVVREDSFPLEFRRSLRHINLKQNPFNCICDLRWFVQWLEETHVNRTVRVEGFPSLYRCRTPPELYDLFIVKYRPTDLQCVDPYLVLSVVLPLVSLLLLTLCFVLYRYRISIRLWLYLLRKKRQHQVLENEEDFVFDAFVAYNKEDHAWVVQELLPLEARGLKLCLHERDFLAGRLVVDNIVDNMEASHKIIVIVSNSFLRSEWCQFELQEALECFLRKRKDVLLVLLEPIAARHVSRPLQVLMKRTTYVEWQENRAARRLFQERLAEPFRREEDTAF